MAQAIVFPDQASADAYSDALDARFGYPRVGVAVGPGTHASVAQSRTAKYASVRKHPALSQWALPDDPVVKAQRSALPLTGGASSQALDPTWEPTVPP